MKIEILPNPAKDNGFKCTKRLLSLLSEYDCEISLPSEFTVLEEFREYSASNKFSPDIIIVLGGDGSIMRASHRSAILGVPLIGINLGRIGFLAEVDPSETELITKIFENEFTIEKRMLLDVRLIRNENEIYSDIALNDAVISHGISPKLIETELFCSGNSLGRYRSDGFVVSTPTGSTAYSLSAGGPIVDPSLRGINLVPVCPHSLMARPMIVPDSDIIEIKYIQDNGGGASLAIDGCDAVELFPKDIIRITKSSLTADFVRLKHDKSRSFYNILRQKMSES